MTAVATIPVARLPLEFMAPPRRLPSTARTAGIGAGDGVPVGVVVGATGVGSAPSRPLPVSATQPGELGVTAAEREGAALGGADQAGW